MLPTKIVLNVSCRDSLVDEQRRYRLERDGFAWFPRRDVRAFPAGAMA
jgi:hypothetical protein